MEDVEFVAIRGPARDPQTDALRVLAPGAPCTVSEEDDEVAVVLADGRQVAPFGAVLDLVGVDPGLVAAAVARDLNHLDQHLRSRTFLTGNALSATDRVVLGLLHSHLAALADADVYQYSCVARWFDHIQAVVPALAHVPIQTSVERFAPKNEKKATGAAAPLPSSSVTDAACLDIRVGRIAHVEGDSTVVSRFPFPGALTATVQRTRPTQAVPCACVQLGDSAGPRQVVSGLTRFVPQAAMRGRYVCVLVNIGASEIKGVPSAGLVLCASNADHSVVEPVRPPDGVAPGERVLFPGVPTRDAIEILKPKRLHKLLKLLMTTDEPAPVAVCGDLPFMTSRGRVTSSPALRNCRIK